MTVRISITRRDGLATMSEKIDAGEYTQGRYAKFGEDLAAAYGVSEHPKKGMLYVIAFHHGNTEGFHGILKWYDELVHLLY